VIHRAIEPLLLEAWSDRPVVFLQGPRQSGKTTLVKRLATHKPGVEYRTFDDLATLGAARGDPAGFVAGFRGRNVILDEVQRAPDVFLPIKYEVDLDRRPGRFLLTGSANAMVVPQLAQALVGRMELTTLWPFAQAEIESVRHNFIDLAFEGELVGLRVPPLHRDDLLLRLVRGGFPEVVTQVAPNRRDEWFAAYISSIIQRDVRDLSRIEALAEMPALLSLIAARAAGSLNLSDLSRSARIPRATLNRYLSLLTALFLIQLIQPWSVNVSSRVVKAPKILMGDTGLLAHLVGLTSLDQLRTVPTQLGPLLENFVGTELLKLGAWSASRTRLWHYRTHEGKEVDFVLEDRRGRLLGIEVKAASTATPGDFKGLLAFAEAVGPKRYAGGAVIYTGDAVVPFGERLLAVPVTALWA
jgi:hypothetical protein